MKDFNLLDHIRGKDKDSIVIWLFNIGVEKNWSDNAVLVKDSKEDTIVNHIEEMNLLLTRKQDYLILRKMPSEFFLQLLRERGFEIPNIICPEREDENKSISELVLEDDSMLRALRKIAEKNKFVYFVPYGVSLLEEKIAGECGLHLLGGTSMEKRLVNNKIFSRETAQNLNYPMAEGVICNTIEEIENAYRHLNKKYNRVIIKMPCNSSGKGMWVIESETRFKTVCLIIRRYFTAGRNSSWIVEGWIDKKTDLNFQVYVSEEGHIETFSVKEQVLKETVYIGSVMPPGISEKQHLQCVEYGEEIGKYLYKKGFTGIFGIDALITNQDQIIPIIEINGRFTLSTYVSFLQKKYCDKVVYTFYKKARFKDCFCYKSLISELGNKGILLEETGIFVYVSATADVKLAEGNCRLFCAVIAESEKRVKELCGIFECICEKYK